MIKDSSEFDDIQSGQPGKLTLWGIWVRGTDEDILPFDGTGEINLIRGIFAGRPKR